MKTILIATLGESPDPIVESALKSGAQELHVLYGVPFLGQTIKDPVKSLQEITPEVEKAGIRLIHTPVTKPADFDSTLAECREALEKALKGTPDKLLVDLTGGTKVMSAAVVHAALTQQVNCEVELVYVMKKGGAEGRPTEMEVRSHPSTVTRELSRQVLKNLSEGRYEIAAVFGGVLASNGKPGFLKAASAFLKAWDDFDYTRAQNLFKQYSLYVQAKTLCEDEELKPLCALIQRLVPLTDKMVEVLRKLRPLQEQKRKLQGNWEDMPLLSADALNNASRRLKEGRYSDAVLRAYRAVEIGIQFHLLLLEINPWNPSYDHLDKEALGSCLKKLRYDRPPEKISMKNGFELVAFFAGIGDLAQTEHSLEALMPLRNLCYLEHGFDILGEESGRRGIGLAEEILRRLLGDFDSHHQRLKHTLNPT